jgi:Protein of unknown function (DUF4238)
MASSESKRGHYVPQFWLRQFAATGGRRYIYVLDKTKTSLSVPPERLRISDIAHEPDFYQYVDSEGKRATLETYLDRRIESPGAQQLRNLIARGSPDKLNGSEREQFAGLIAAQALRTLHVRLSESDQRNQALIAVKRFLQRLGDGNEELDDPPIMDDARAHANLIRQFTPALTKNVLDLRWVLLRHTSSLQFWLSDNPVLKWEDEGLEVRDHLSGPVVEIYAPLDPRHAFMAVSPSLQDDPQNYIEFGVHTSSTPIDVDEKVAHILNEREFLEAERFVFSQTAAFDSAVAWLEEDRQLRQGRRAALRGIRLTAQDGDDVLLDIELSPDGSYDGVV